MVHKNCPNVSKKKYEKLKNDPLPWYCSLCKNEKPFFLKKAFFMQKILYSIKTVPLKHCLRKPER